MVCRAFHAFAAASLLISLLVSSAAYAQEATSKPQEVFAPYWTSEPGWATEFQLKNNLASGSLTVTPVLRIADGTEFGLDPVVIASNAAVSVRVNDALPGAPRLVPFETWESASWRSTRPWACRLSRTF